jgi:hypothetical protein
LASGGDRWAKCNGEEDALTTRSVDNSIAWLPGLDDRASMRFGAPTRTGGRIIAKGKKRAKVQKRGKLPKGRTASRGQGSQGCENQSGCEGQDQVRMIAGSMQLSNYSLDNFVAHKLSLLTECSAPELSANPNWIGQFVLNTMLVANLPPKQRAFAFTFLRRAEGAFSAYRAARSALTEYFNTPRNVLSPYFRALLNFEVCIGQCYQGFELLERASGKRVFQKNDMSDGERLHDLYIASKHMDRMIAGNRLPTEATAAIWITNVGLESKQAKLTFDELFEILRSMGKLADEVSTLGATTAKVSS